jgi:RHS repeat-associated protein
MKISQTSVLHPKRQTLVLWLRLLFRSLGLGLSYAWLVGHALASTQLIDDGGKTWGALGDASATGVGALAFDSSGKLEVLNGPGYTHLPFAVSPDGSRRFEASSGNVTEHALMPGYPSRSWPVGGGEVKALAVDPGGEWLYVVLESTDPFTVKTSSVNRGLNYSKETWNKLTHLPRDRVSVVALDISAPLGLSFPALERPKLVLDGVAYHVSDMAVSPDGSLGLITVAGAYQNEVSTRPGDDNLVDVRVTPFGVIHGPDEATGGVFVVDLRSWKQLDYLPTDLSGGDTREIRQSIVNSGSRIKHMAVYVAEQQYGVALGEFEILSSMSSAFTFGGGMSAFTGYVVRTANLLDVYDSYRDFGYVAAYGYTYPFDMIKATGVGFSNRGDLAMVTMESTNNIGVIPVPWSLSASGDQHFLSGALRFESAMTKTINGENIDWAWAGGDSPLHQGINSSGFSFWGPSDVAFSTDDSKVLVGAYGRPTGGLSNGRYGVVHLERDRDHVLGSDPNVKWVELRSSTLTYPKHVATIPAFDNDGDGLSNYLEVYNSLPGKERIPAGDPAKIASLELADINVPAASRVHVGRSGLTHYLLPDSGEGYRFQHLGQDRNTANAGNAIALAGIERLGRAWRASSASRPYFLVQRIASPGGGLMFNRVGDLVDFNERAGYDVNLSYFSANSDFPFDVVPSNVRGSLTDNTISSLNGMDKDATFHLIDLLLADAGVREIWIDPMVAREYQASRFLSSKPDAFVIRGVEGVDYEGRRDCDSFMKVVFGAGVLAEIAADGVRKVGDRRYLDLNRQGSDGVPLSFSSSAADFYQFSINQPLYLDAQMTKLLEFPASGKLLSTVLVENPILYVHPGQLSNLELTLYDAQDTEIGRVPYAVEGVQVKITSHGVPSMSAPDGEYKFPGWADGFDLDKFTAEGLRRDRIDDDADNQGSSLGGSPFVFQFQGAGPDARIRLSYPASAPSAVSHYIRQVGRWVPQQYETVFQLPDKGWMRLWKNDSAQRAFSDYVAPGIYSIAELGGNASGLTLYGESVSAALGGELAVAIDPDGAGPAGFVSSDSVLLGTNLLSASSDVLAPGVPVDVTVSAAHGPVESWQLLYDPKVMSVMEVVPPNPSGSASLRSLGSGTYTGALPGTLTVMGLQKPENSVAASAVPLTLMVHTRSQQMGEIELARGTGWKTFEKVVHPAGTGVGRVSFRMEGESRGIRWDRDQAFKSLLSVVDDDTPIQMGTNRLELKALATLPSDTVRYGLESWKPEGKGRIGKRSEPTVDAMTGMVTAGDREGELVVYAYIEQDPELRTKSRHIRIGGCKSCSDGATFCVQTDLEKGLKLDITLGITGNLRLDSEVFHTLLGSPANLRFYEGCSHADSIMGRNGMLSEVRSDDALFLIRNLTQTQLPQGAKSAYTIEAWVRKPPPPGTPLPPTPPPGVPPPPSDPVTTVNGEAQGCIRVEMHQNPDAPELRILHSGTLGADDLTYANADRVDAFVFDSSSGSWILYQGLTDVGSTPRIFERAIERTVSGTLHGVTLSKTTPNGNVYRESNQSIDAAGSILSIHQKTYVESDFGDLLLESREIFPASTRKDLVTTYDYYPDGLMKSMRSSDGSWEDYAWDHAQERITKVESPFLNATSGTSQVQTTEYSYDRALPGDNSAVHPDAPRTIRTRITGQEMSVVKRAYDTGWSAHEVDGLRTETFFYTGSDNPDLQGRTKRVIHPDGRQMRYLYEQQRAGGPGTALKHERITVESGLVAGESITDGRRSVTDYDGEGRRIASESIDIASGQTLSREVAVGFDREGRVTAWEYLDGTSSQRQYGCCGVEWEEDRNGQRSDYTYDALKRLRTRTRDGITESYSYDALGRQTEVKREGQVVSRTEYADGGNTVHHIDPLGRRSTTRTEQRESGGQVTRSTGPSGEEVVETTTRDGRVLEVTGTGTAPLRYEYATESADGKFTMRTTQYRLDANGNDSGEFTRSWTDGQGRTIRQEDATGAATTYHYNAKGQLVRTTDPDGVTVLYSYNARGEQEMQAVDVNGNGQIDLAGPDRVNRSRTWVEASGTAGEAVRVTVQEGWLTEGSAAAVQLSRSESSLDGRRSWSTDAAGAVTYSERTLPSNGSWQQRTVLPDGSERVQQFSEGRVQSVELRDRTGSVIQSQSFTYDGLGRTQSVTDGRKGTTTYTYYADDQVATITEPGSDGFGPRVTRFQYNEAGRLVRTDLPDGSSRHQEYHPNGAIKRQWGSQQYPVGYEYDAQGRVTTQSTWQGFDPATGNGTGTPALTRWVYDPATGQLQQKQHADGKGPSYTYTPGGRLASRTWARGISTTYAYGADGMMASLDHSDSTPDVSFSYTRSGQLDTVEDAVSGSTRFTHSYTYSPIGQLTTETSDTTVERSLTRIYETGSATAGRFLGWDLGSEGSAEAIHWQRYGYDGAGRLNQVSSPAGNYAYTYLPQSHLLASVTGPVHSVVNSYESARDVMTAKTNQAASGIVSRLGARYDALGRRIEITRSGSAFTQGFVSQYDFDVLGQLTKDERFAGEVPGDPAAKLEEESFAFLFDGIGNRLTAQKGTDTTTYTPNALNQYTAIGAMQPVHDADGNLVADGNRRFVWDAENRLILVEPVVATEGTKRLEFQYDYIGRRVSKQVWTRTGGAWVDESTTAFVYDGWNLIEEVSTTGAGITATKHYTWGIDLSGSLQGAGGVGGLLAQTHSDSSGTRYFHYLYDLNGNISEVLDGSGTIAAHYEYGPFGELIHEFISSDSHFSLLTFNFSTKYHDRETGLLYYGYRYYDSANGRWLNRDPIEEEGGLNLYGFVGNDGVNWVDLLGMVIGGFPASFSTSRHATIANDPSIVGGFIAKWSPSPSKFLDVSFLRIRHVALNLGANLATSAEFVGKFVYRVGVHENVDLDFLGLTVAQHEDRHRSIHEKWWNAMKDAVERYEGEWNSGDCAFIVSNLAKAIYAYYFWSAAVENKEFDILVQMGRNTTHENRATVRKHLLTIARYQSEKLEAERRRDFYMSKYLEGFGDMLLVCCMLKSK